MKKIKLLIGLAVSSVLAACAFEEASENWQHPTEVVQTENILNFPADFKWSAGTSHLQHDGTYWKTGRGESHFGMMGQGFSMGESIAVVNDLNRHWQQDIQDMKEAGLTAYRFSLDWAWILPSGFPQDPMGNSAVNPVAIDFYNRYIDELIANGIEPTVTLYHYDMPIALALPQFVMEQQAPGAGLGGSFNNRLTAELWLAFAQVAFDNFGDRVTHWYTFNEIINGVMLDGLMSSVFELVFSGQEFNASDLMALISNKSTSDFIGENLDFIHNVMWAHASAKAMAEQMGVIGKVGFINTFMVPKASNDPKDQEAARLSSLLHNQMLIGPLSTGQYPQEILDLLAQEGYGFSAQTQATMAQDLQLIQAMGTDFAAINYYNRSYVHHDEGSPFGKSEQFHELAESVLNYYKMTSSNPSPSLALAGYDPQGLYETLMMMSAQLPAGVELIVSENGAAPIPDDGNMLLTSGGDKLTDDGKVHDPQRIDYLKGHISAVHKAITDGANVTMYSVWSMWDLWEFSRFSNVFGLIYVDYDDPQRTRYKKDSYYWYSDVVKNNRLILKD